MENLKLENLNQKHNKDETITELAHRHMNDKNHTTTDEELKNAKLVLSQNVEEDEENLFEVDNTTVISPLAIDKRNDTDNTKNEKNENKSLPNPYSVIGG